MGNLGFKPWQYSSRVYALNHYAVLLNSTHFLKNPLKAISLTPFYREHWGWEGLSQGLTPRGSYMELVCLEHIVLLISIDSHDYKNYFSLVLTQRWGKQPLKNDNYCHLSHSYWVKETIENSGRTVGSAELMPHSRCFSSQLHIAMRDSRPNVVYQLAVTM